MIKPLILYILRSALRHKFLWVFLISVLVAISLSLFIGASAVTEKDQFALIFIASSLRLISVFLIMLFVCGYVRQAFDNQDVEYLLSRSVSRLDFLISYSISFGSLAVLLAFLVGSVLWVLPFEKNDLLLWASGLSIELIMISQAAIFFSLVLRNAIASVFAVSGLYVLGRLIGDILAVIHSSADSSMIILLEKIMLLVSIFTPRFDLLAQSQWLLYQGAGEHVLLVVVQCVVLSLILFLSGYFDFKRKEF